MERFGVGHGDEHRGSGTMCTIVNVYQIFNRYESVILTFSYREAEREIWKSIHNNITESFSFIKIY